MAQSFWQKLAKKVDKNLLGEGLGTAEFDGYIDTGSYSLNMLASGTLFGGIPNNSFTGLAGETTTGKTFFSLGIVKNFLQNEEAGAVYADTESAIQAAMAEARGMDGMRITQLEPPTVEDFRTDMLEFMDAYEKAGAERPPLMAVLDSLGALSTRKEIEDTATFGDSKEAEKKRNTKDMTRAQVIKGAFRVLRLKMAKLKVPMVITNHLYANVGGYGPAMAMGGGSGLKYAADAIWFLTKAKAKEGDATDGEVIGSKITATAVKSRLARENAKVQVLLNYNTGLDRYYGLLDMGIDAGVIQKLPQGFMFPGDIKVSRKDVLRNPEQVYTPEVLKQIDEAANPMFSYGKDGNPNYVSPDDEAEEE